MWVKKKICPLHFYGKYFLVRLKWFFSVWKSFDSFVIVLISIQNFSMQLFFKKMWEFRVFVVQKKLRVSNLSIFVWRLDVPPIAKSITSWERLHFGCYSFNEINLRKEIICIFNILYSNLVSVVRNLLSSESTIVGLLT